MPRSADSLPGCVHPASRAHNAMAPWRRAFRHTVTLSACGAGYVGAVVGGTAALSDLAMTAWNRFDASKEAIRYLPTVAEVARSSLEVAWQAAAWQSGVIASGTVLWRLLVQQHWAPASVRALLSTIFGVAFVCTAIALETSQLDVTDFRALGIVSAHLALVQTGVAAAVLKWAGHLPE